MSTNTKVGGVAFKSKFSSPPTLAHYKRHEEWSNLLSQMEELTPWNDTIESDLKPSGLPLKLQAYANQHSLKPTKEEVSLQHEVEELERAGMAGAPDEANLLCLLLEMMDAKTVVEVGVFRGTTTLALALCLKGLDQKNAGMNRKVIGLDVSSDYAEIGKKYWKLAEVEDFIDLRINDAKESLSGLLEEAEYGENSVDLCFIDADKSSYDNYYEMCLKLSKSGGLIVVDNTLWGGTVATPDEILTVLASKASDYEINDTSEKAMAAHRAKDTMAIKALADKIYQDDRVERVSFLTIADGVIICRKK